MTSSVHNSTRVSEAVNTQTEPYVGPRPFTKDDRDIFFGRYRETLELTSLIKAHPEVLVYAQSGAGKTSLIYAQLITTLDLEEEFHVLPPARVRSQQIRRIADDKIRNIYMFNALRDLSDDKLSLLQRAQMTLVDYLKDLPRPPVKTAPISQESAENESSKNRGETQPELRLARAIIFDQFEEIFTLYQDRYKDRLDFFRQVADALEADPFLRVVFSMREDYIAELDPYIDVLPQKLCTRFRLEPLRRPNALAAVTKPLLAERVTNQRAFADQAAESLVESLMLIKVKTATGEKKEVPGEFVDPVQLQVVCQTLWEKLPTDVTEITETHLKEYANVDEALLTYYENSVRKAVHAGNAAIEATTRNSAKPVAIPNVTEGMVRRWFDQYLITREGKRNMVFRGDKKTGNLPNEVVGELDTQHLIRGEMRGEDTWFELSHDRFIAPIRESNQRWISQQPLSKQLAQELETRAAMWNAEKDQSLLLDRAALLNAKNWRESPEASAIGCSEALESLIRQSEAAIESEDRKQLEDLALAEQLRANAEHQRARQFKLGLVIASLLLVVAVSTSVSAWRAEARAQQNFNRAQVALDEATQAKLSAMASDRETQSTVKMLKETNDELNAAREAAEREKAVAISAGEKEKQQRAIAVKAEAETAKVNRSLAEANRGLKDQKDRLQAQNFSSVIDAWLPGDPELGLRLALNAVDRWPTMHEARFSLRQAYLAWPQSHYVLRPHEQDINRGIFSPDGLTIITTGQDLNNDYTVRIWDVARKKEKSPPLLGHKGRIEAVAFSSDGTRLATEAADGTARIWWLQDGSSKELPGLTGPVPAIAFSRDNKLLATEATADNDRDKDRDGFVANIWDAEDKSNVTPLVTLRGHTDAVSAISFSPVDDKVATASWDGTARIWDSRTGEPLLALVGHTARVNRVAFDPSGRGIATASDDGTARVWEVQTGAKKLELQGHLGYVTDVKFSPDGNRLLTRSGRKAGSGTPEDNVVRIWDAHTGLLTALLSGHTKKINDASFSADGRMIVTASDDGISRIWSSLTGKEVMELKGHEGSITRAVFSPKSPSVLTIGTDQTAQLWRIPSSALSPKYFFARRSGDDLGRIEASFSSNEEVVTTGTDGRVRYWNSRTLREEVDKRVVPPRPDKIDEKTQRYLRDIQKSPDGRYVVMALRPVLGKITKEQARVGFVWDTGKQKTFRLAGHTGPINRVVYSPKGTYVLTAGEEGSAIVWNTSTWTVFRTLRPKPYHGPRPESHDKEKSDSDPGADEEHSLEAGIILDAAFDLSEKYVVTGQENGTIHLWEIATGESKQAKADEDGVLTVSFNKAGNRILTGGFETIAKVWTLDLQKTAVLGGHAGLIFHAEFSSDGNFIVTSGGDNKVIVWETETGARVQIFESADIPTSAALSPDNKLVVVGGGLIGFGEVFECEACRPFEQIKEEARRNKPRQLTKSEKEKFGLLDKDLPEKQKE